MTNLRRPFVAGNWKMNTTLDEATALAGAIGDRPPVAVEIAIFPPFPWLVPVASRLARSEISIGAQDCWIDDRGAVTGAVSPAMLRDLCRYVIVGHSERRGMFGETDELVASKAAAAIRNGLTPIVCVGEPLSVRESGGANDFVTSQVLAAVEANQSSSLAHLVFAYEPIWAIGTGVAASGADAQAMASLIRSAFADRYPGLAERVRILYGGSVTAGNARALMSGKDVNGALVGGASLDPVAFLAIASAAVD